MTKRLANPFLASLLILLLPTATFAVEPPKLKANWTLQGDDIKLEVSNLGSSPILVSPLTNCQRVSSAERLENLAQLYFGRPTDPVIYPKVFFVYTGVDQTLALTTRGGAVPHPVTILPNQHAIVTIHLDSNFSKVAIESKLTKVALFQGDGVVAVIDQPASK